MENTVTQTVTIDIVSALVYHSDGQEDVVVVELPVLVPLEGSEENLKVTFIADRGTGIDFLKSKFGIDGTVVHERFNFLDALQGYGIDARDMHDAIA